MTSLLVKLLNARYILDLINFDCLSVFGQISATIVLFALASFSRIGALYQNYHASMDVWVNVSHLVSSLQLPIMCPVFRTALTLLALVTVQSSFYHKKVGVDGMVTDDRSIQN